MFSKYPPEQRNSQTLIEETEAQYCFTAFPNPAHSFVEFNMKGIPLTTEATIQIHDLAGKLLFSSSTLTPNQPTLMDLEHLDPGTYVVTLKDREQFICSQILLVW
jgi:hypothetical protein